MSQKIIDALQKLDPLNDNHWTADGQPRLDTVKFSAADQSITREMIVAVAPEFSRGNPTLPAQPAAIATPAQGTPPVVPVVVPQPGKSDAGNANPGGQAPGLLKDEHGGSDEGKDDLNAAIAKASEYVEKLRAARNEFDIEFARAQAELDALLDEQAEVGGKETTMDAIQGYLKAQRANMAQRGERARALKEAGVDPQVLQVLGGSKLDSAMRRQTGFGNSRPGAVKGE